MKQSTEAQHPCRAAGCTHYHLARMPSRTLHWCQIHHSPMAPCLNIARAPRGGDLLQPAGNFCAGPRRGAK